MVDVNDGEAFDPAIQPSLPHTPDFTRPVAMKEARIHGSCDECLGSKVKCSKERPTCQRCEQLQRQCNYSHFRRMGRPRQKYPVPNEDQRRRKTPEHNKEQARPPPLLPRSEALPGQALGDTGAPANVDGPGPLDVNWTDMAPDSVWNAGDRPPPGVPEQLLTTDFAALTDGLAPYPSPRCHTDDLFPDLQDMHPVRDHYHQSSIAAPAWDSGVQLPTATHSVSTSPHMWHTTATDTLLRSRQGMTDLFNVPPPDSVLTPCSTQSQVHQLFENADFDNFYYRTVSPPSDGEHGQPVHRSKVSTTPVTVPDGPRCAQQCLGALNEQLENITRRQDKAARLDHLLQLHKIISEEHQKTLFCAVCMATPRRGHTVMIMLMVVSKLQGLFEAMQVDRSETYGWRDLCAGLELSVGNMILDGALKIACCRELIQLYVLRLLKSVEQFKAILPRDGGGGDISFKIAGELLMDVTKRAQGLFGLTVLECDPV